MATSVQIKRYNGTTWDNISPKTEWSDVQNKPSTFTPSSHTHTKSQITDFPSSMPASDVYAWAKASTKPSYNLSEISNRQQGYIDWGGPSLSSNASPLEVATIDDLGHNKFAFMSAASVKAYYSRDGGSTWTEFGSDNSRRALVTLTSGFHIGDRTGANNTVNDKLRILLNSNNAGGNLYCSLRRLLVYISTAGSGGCTVKVEYRTIGNYQAGNDTWGDGGTYGIGGWSGWNSIPFQAAFGGSNDQTTQTAQIRLTFGVTSVSSTYGNLELIAIRGIGFPVWQSPSTMASTGHLYSFDIAGNATFPASVSAVRFTENGTELSNKYLAKSGGNMTGHIYLTGANANSSTSNTSQVVFGTSADNHVAVSSNSGILIVNPSTSDTTGQICLRVGSNPYIKVNGTEVSLVGHTHNYLSAESDTLATVTGRGASTSTQSTFSGGVKLSYESTAYNTKGIVFAVDNKEARIGADSTGDLGLYSYNDVYIRPSCTNGASSYGLLMTSTNFSPTTNESMSLGTSSYQYNNIYGKTLYENGTSLVNKYQAKGDYSTTADVFGMNATVDRFTFTLSSRKITNTTARNTWDSQVYSSYGHKTDLYMSFRAGQTDKYIMAGLDSDPASSASYNNIDYCWYIQTSGALSIYESGSPISVTGHTTYATGDEFRIEYSDGKIRYYHNGTLCRTVDRALGNPLQFDSSFYNGGYIFAVEFDTMSHQDISGKLDKSGGAMTGDISYAGSKSTTPIIKFLNNTSDAYGNGIAIGGGGIVIVGAGESSGLSYGSAGDENLILAADTGIKFYSNAQDGLSTAKNMVFDASGNLSVPGTISSGGTAVSLSGHTHSQYLTSHQAVSSPDNAAVWGQSVLVGTVGGNELRFTMPANPNTNTATAADGIFKGSNSGTEISIAPYPSTTANAQWVANSSNYGKFYLGSQAPHTSANTRLNYNGYLYANKLYSGGTEVSVKGHTHNDYVIRNTSTICIGNGTDSSNNGTNAVTLGYDACSAGGNSSIAIGYNAYTSADGAVAIGYATNYGIADGNEIDNGLHSIAMGYNARSTGAHSIAIGSAAYTQYIPSGGVSSTCSIAIGASALARNTYAVAIGPDANVGGYSSIAIGNGAYAYRGYCIAIGHSTAGDNYDSNATNCIAIGNNINANAKGATIIGFNDSQSSVYNSDMKSIFFINRIKVNNSITVKDIIDWETGTTFFDYNKLINKPLIQNNVTSVLDLTRSLPNNSVQKSGGVLQLNDIGEFDLAYYTITDPDSDICGESILTFSLPDIEENGGGWFALIYDSDDERFVMTTSNSGSHHGFYSPLDWTIPSNWEYYASYEHISLATLEDILPLLNSTNMSTEIFIYVLENDYMIVNDYDTLDLLDGTTINSNTGETTYFTYDYILKLEYNVEEQTWTITRTV